jgi:RND family efflux transporter MFP subunit
MRREGTTTERTTLLVGLTALLVLDLATCKEDRTPAPVLEPARSAASARPAPPPSGFIGVVVAGESADIEPKAEGRIEQVFVSAGDKVARGAPLARLDAKGMRHELDGANAALREASRRYERRRQLSRKNAGAVTAEELESAEREMLQERARVARLTEAMGEALVTAPFAGTVAERYLAAGAQAGPGRPIVRLAGAGEPRVRFAIPEDRAQSVIPGRFVDVAISPLNLTLRGRITGLSPEVDASSRMVYATAALEEPTGDGGASRLHTGLITRVFLAEGMAAAVERTPPPEPAAAPAPTATTLTPPAPARPTPRPRKTALDKW